MARQQLKVLVGQIQYLAQLLLLLAAAAVVRMLEMV
jgi:hypothetical protein